MVTKLAALAALGLGGLYLIQRRQPAPVAGTDNPGAFGWLGFPASPDEFDRANEPWGGPLDLSFLPDLFPSGPVESTEADQGGSVFDLINGTGSIWDMTQPRGIRNNNPGNLEDTGINWHGIAEPRNDGRFLRFTDPVYGIRAMARNLHTYATKHSIDSVGGIINRWAPSHGRFDGSSYRNNTGAYAAHVADHLGVRATDKIDVIARRPELIEAMIQFENGEQPYPMALIKQGVALA